MCNSDTVLGLFHLMSCPPGSPVLSQLTEAQPLLQLSYYYMYKSHITSIWLNCYHMYVYIRFLAWFFILTIMNNVSVILELKISFQYTDFITFMYTFSSQIASHCTTPIFKFASNYWTSWIFSHSSSPLPFS